MDSHLKNLARSLEDCRTSTDYVRVIDAITRTEDPDAIAILASLLDTPGPVGAAAVQGLVTFGLFAEQTMRRLITRSLDEDQIRNAHRVLAQLGDARSNRAQHAVCWADFEEEEEARERAAAERKAAAHAPDAPAAAAQVSEMTGACGKVIRLDDFRLQIARSLPLPRERDE